MYFSTVLAAITNKVITRGDESGTTYIPDFVQRLITIILVIGSLLFFFTFLMGAIRWITSGGDKGQVESARAQITQALTGIVIMFSVWAIAGLLQSLLGINLLNLDLSGVMP